MQWAVGSEQLAEIEQSEGDESHCVNMQACVFIARGTSMTESYRKLIAWQKSKALALDIYRCTREFPKDELYGLTSQMRRAAISVPSNIAEGSGRHSRKEFLQFLYHARGSLLELENQVEIARDLEYLDATTCASILRKAEELGRILNGLVNRFQMELGRVS